MNNINEDESTDEFGVGLTIDELISQLTKLREIHGNIHVALDTGSKRQSWHGMLDNPAVVPVQKNAYKACYEPKSDSELKICIF